MKRIHQSVLIVSLLPLCWFAMMGVHEWGHVIAGWATGGEVQKVVLHPLSISRTDIEPNPRPLITVWAGPLIGVLLPLAIWAICFWRRLPCEYLFRFFAGFCLIANGAYIGVGSAEGIGDAGKMLQFGSPTWLLCLFGVITIPLGFRLWHGLGPKFGLGKSPNKTNPKTAYTMLFLLITLLITLTTLSPRS